MDRDDWIAHIVMVLAAVFATWIIHLADPSWSALYGSIIAFTIIILVYFAVFWWMRWDLRRHLRRMDEMFQQHRQNTAGGIVGRGAIRKVQTINDHEQLKTGVLFALRSAPSPVTLEELAALTGHPHVEDIRAAVISLTVSKKAHPTVSEAGGLRISSKPVVA